MKKNLFRLMAFMMVAMLTVGFISCSKDDDDLKQKISKTTWLVTESSDEEEMPKGFIITFKPDGKIITNDQEWNSGNNTYSILSDGQLMIDFNHDDYMLGAFKIDGNKAVYTFSWYDSVTHKVHENGAVYTIILQKQSYDERPAAVLTW